jgi:hypothetical protein
MKHITNAKLYLHLIFTAAKVHSSQQSLAIIMQKMQERCPPNLSKV